MTCLCRPESQGRAPVTYPSTGQLAALPRRFPTGGQNFGLAQEPGGLRRGPPDAARWLQAEARWSRVSEHPDETTFHTESLVGIER